MNYESFSWVAVESDTMEYHYLGHIYDEQGVCVHCGQKMGSPSRLKGSFCSKAEVPFGD